MKNAMPTLPESARRPLLNQVITSAEVMAHSISNTENESQFPPQSRAHRVMDSTRSMLELFKEVSEKVPLPSPRQIEPH